MYVLNCIFSFFQTMFVTGKKNKEIETAFNFRSYFCIKWMRKI